jgi:hypothetical protein
MGVDCEHPQGSENEQRNQFPSIDHRYPPF